MAIPDSYLQELRSRADIEQIISPYVTLRRAGRLLMGLCPFHNEKTPSFAVYPDSSSFYCFGCGAGGDAVSFLMRMERLDYVEAVKALSQRLGMQLPEDQYDDGLAKKRQRILSANREAARFFHQQLKEEKGRVGLDYWLNKRGLAPETVKHFGLGYAPAEWSALLDHMRSLGYTAEELVEANLVTRSDKNNRISHFDRFRGRVMVPILDLRGNVIAFGGRVLDDTKPKYINTSDTLAYKKGRDIYALNFAKNEARGRLILCEVAFGHVGYTIKWQGEGVDEVGICEQTGKTIVRINPKFFRPAEVEVLLGNPDKAETKLGWRREISFSQLVERMVGNDLHIQSEALK